MVTAVVLILSVGLFMRVRRPGARSSEPGPATVALPQIADVRWDERWPRLVVTGLPARPLDEIRAAYAFAARRPDVLEALPCSCGCKRQGHAGNEACYIKGRSSWGVPRWTDHAITCGICLDITHDAIVMTADHQPIEAIRHAIKTKYQEQ